MAAVQATNNRSGKSSFFILDNIIEVCFSLLSCVFVKHVVESYIKIKGIDHCFLRYHLSRQYMNTGPVGGANPTLSAIPFQTKGLAA